MSDKKLYLKIFLISITFFTQLRDKRIGMFRKMFERSETSGVYFWYLRFIRKSLPISRYFKLFPP